MKSIKDYSVEYSTVRCFSDSNQWCVLLHNFQTFDLFDKDLNFNRQLKIAANQEPRWFGELLYFIVGRSLMVFDFDKNSLNKVHEFNEYLEYTSDQKNGVRGLGEGDIENGKIALIGENENGSKDIFLFDLLSLSKGLYLNTDKTFDNIYATPDGQVIVSWLASGPLRYQGVELFDKDMNFLRQLTTVNSHMDIGPRGLVWCSSPDPVINSNSVYLVNEQKSLFKVGWEYALHISCCKDFCVVSLNDPKGIAPFQLWKISYEGKQELINTYVGSYKGYESAQKASVSKDGSKIARCRFDEQNYFADIFGLDEKIVIEDYPGFKEITSQVKKRYLLELNEDGTYREFEKI